MGKPRTSTVCVVVVVLNALNWTLPATLFPFSIFPSPLAAQSLRFLATSGGETWRS